MCNRCNNYLCVAGPFAVIFTIPCVLECITCAYNRCESQVVCGVCVCACSGCLVFRFVESSENFHSCWRKLHRRLVVRCKACDATLFPPVGIIFVVFLASVLSYYCFFFLLFRLECCTRPTWCFSVGDVPAMIVVPFSRIRNDDVHVRIRIS